MRTTVRKRDVRQSAPGAQGLRNGGANKILDADRPAHDWYRFVLSYPPHLVRHYLREFNLDPYQVVLDPFCGTGTTIVECKKLGIPSVGIEANRMAYFASCVKVDWAPDPDSLLKSSHKIAEAVGKTLHSQGIPDGEPFFERLSAKEAIELRTLPEETHKLLLAGSISPLPLHKTLVLLEAIELSGSPFILHQKLAMAKSLVNSIGNLHFGPEVGVGPAKPDAAVVPAWLSQVDLMANHLRALRSSKSAPADLHYADSRDILRVLRPNSIDAVITSPPYPNEKDYTRTTRLESVLLGFLRNKHELQELKRTLMRSNTRNVYKGDDDDQWVSDHSEIQAIASRIEARRIELGKTSGFERMYAKVTKLYFGGMMRHLAQLRTILRPGAHLVYVVGDQASYLRVLIRTGKLLADLAQSLGYELVRIDLFRTRLSTATREQMREEAVILRWPGQTHRKRRPSAADSARGIEAIPDCGFLAANSGCTHPN